MVRQRKLFISLLLILLGAFLWRFVRSPSVGQSSAATLAASLLPLSSQPLQLGARLAPEAVELGNVVTLSLLLRNNDSRPHEPTVTVKLPPTLRFEEQVLEEALIFNATEQTLHWYPQLAEDGDVALQELRFLVFQPTAEGQQDEVAIQLVAGETVQDIYLPFWAGEALQPTAVFTANDLQAGVDQQLLFTNQSAGQPPLTYRWEFGDGTISTAAQPYHGYSTPGQYLVQLTVSNELGEATHSLPITVGAPPVVRLLLEEHIYAGEPFVAQAFADGSETLFEWRLGDGSQQNGFWIEHQYATAGEYALTLNATNAFGNTVIAADVLVQAQRSAPTESEAHLSPLPVSSPTVDVRTLDIQLEPDPEFAALSLPDQLLGYINKARQQANLLPLEWSYALSQAAQEHTDAAAFGYVNGHIGLGGSTPYDRVEQANYQEGFLIGEATAWGFNSALAAVQFWLDSPEHRPLLLSHEADQVGVGQSTNYETNYVWYWTAEFASFELPKTAVVYSGAAPVPPVTATLAPTQTPSVTPTPLATATATLTPTPTPTLLPTGRPTLTPTATVEPATPTLTPTPTAIVPLTPTVPITQTLAPEQTPSPTATPTPTPDNAESSRASPTLIFSALAPWLMILNRPQNASLPIMTPHLVDEEGETR